MKNIHKILFLFVLIIFNSIPSYSINKGMESGILKTVADPSGQIVGNATVCQKAAAPIITFTGSGGSVPYTFTYHINSGAPLTVATTGNNSSVTVAVNTSNAGIFIYNLDSVHDVDTPNEQGSSGSATVNIISPPVVDFTFTNDNSCMGTAIQFSSNLTGGSYTYSWDFGDSTTSTQQNPVHSFVSLGCNTAIFNVTLTVTGGACTVTKTKTVTVKQKPDIDFTDVNNLFDPFSNCGNASSSSAYSITVGNNSASTCVSSFSINWGDGNTQANITFPISHTYSSIGAYSMTINANGNNGCSNSKTYIVKNVSNPLGGLNSPGSTQNLCAPTSNLQFSISNWGTNSLDTTYKVDYGDGSSITILTQNQLNSSIYYNSGAPSNSSNYPISHIYTSSSCPANSFEVKLDVSNACGTTPFTLGNISILTRPTANFTAPITSCINNNVLFTNTTVPGYGQNCSKGSIFTWDFGDGSAIIKTGISAPQNINHIYSNPGTYTVTLKAQNACGTTTKTQTICIQEALVPTFTLSQIAACTPLAVATTNTTNLTASCAAPTYKWNIAYTASYCSVTSNYTLLNGTTLTSFAPEFNFINPGIYSLSLTTTNSCGSVTSAPQTVTIKQPPTVILSPIASLCQTLPTTTINPTAVIVNCGTQSPLSYEWSFQGGSPSTAATANPGTISYSASGTFLFSLKVTNECSSTTSSSSFTINPSPTISGTLFSCIGTSSQLTGSPSAVAATPWTSSATAVATVNNTGLVTAVSAGTTTITYTNDAGCKTTVLFNVNPAPVVTFSPANQIICSDDTSALVTLNSTTSGATFNWTAVQPTGISGVSTSGTDIIPAQTLINNTNASIVLTYNSRATSANGASCAGAIFPYTITVKPKPNVAANITTAICSGSSFAIAPINGAGNIIPTGTNYSWGVPVVTGGITGGVAGTNAATISGTLTNPTNVVQTATYTVIPSANGCAGLPFDVVVSVKPKPDVNAITSVALCAGISSTLIDFTGNVSGTTYNWSSSTTSIGVAASGINTIPSFTAINTGATAVTSTITVIPVVNGCTGLSKTFDITVNPTPTVNSIPDLIKCNTASSGVIAFSGNVSGTTFDWTNDTPSIGLAAVGSGNIASFTATNTMLISVTATITVSPKANGCLGTPKTFTITVNPSPTMDLPLSQTICNGQSSTAILFSGAIPSTVYKWTNSNPTIGIGATGTGDIPAFTAINNGTNPIVANFTVTPSLNGCIGATRPFTITINPSPAVVFSPIDQVLCSASSSVLVTLSSTIAGTNFTWTAVEPAGISGITASGNNTIPVQTLTNSTGLPIIITYLATAESNSGASCQGALYPYTITVNPVPSIITPQAQTICSNTAFSIIPSYGSGNIVPAGTTYSWGVPVITGGITGAAALTNQTNINGTLVNHTNDLQTATYTVTPKSGSCTGSSFTAVVTVNPSPKVVFSGNNQTLCSGSDSSPITLASPTTGTLIFNWTANVPAGISGATSSGINTIPTQTLVNLTTNPLPVTYTSTATLDNNGVSCTGQPFDYKIIVNPTIITSSILSNFNGFNVSAVGVSDGAINVTVKGGSGAYTYLWSGPGSFSSTSQDISNVAAGAYTLTINDGVCDVVTLNFTLTSPLPLLIQEDIAGHSDVLCFGYSSGNIKVDITQQSVGPYDYVLTLQGGRITSSIIDSVATNYIFTGLAAGTYDIRVTDANGSVKTILGIVITQPSGITALISGITGVSCAGAATGSATVNASGGIGNLAYSWNSSPIQTLATATALTAGIYTVTITDTNNCSIQKQAVITEPNGIVTSIAAQTNILCFGNSTGSATVSASGGSGVLTYSWNTVPVQSIATATGLTAGSYDVTVTDANGCSKVQTVLITQPSVGLSSVISNSNNVSCFGGNDGSATVSVSGGTSPYSYSWNTSPIQTLSTATGLKAGIYNVTVTDANGCGTSSPITITEPAGMIATITAQTDVFCSGNSTGSATVTATGGTAPFTYSWNTIPVQTSNVATNLAIGTYAVTVTDSKACSTSTQAIIKEPNGIVTAIASQTNVDCFGNNTGAVSIVASGGTGTLTYSWDTIPVQTSLNPTGLIAGIYHLTVTDANSCSKVQTVNITQPDDIVITTDLEKDITCFNDANGEIKITISGGTLDYKFAWTKNGIPYATTEDILNLSPGVYVVSVSDANNCSPKTRTFTISEPPALAVSLISQTNILCFGESTGAINISAVGGTPAISDYDFAWTGPNGYTSSNKNLSDIIAGTYDLVVTDNSGCSKALSVTLSQPAAIVLTATTTPIICYGDNNASITLAISGGVTPYTIDWSNLGGGNFQDNLSAGDYLITVTDANNCKQTLNVNIPAPPIFTISPVVKNSSCFGDYNGSINLNLLGGIAPVKLTWDDNSTAGTVRNNLGPGSYTVTIVDSKPCTIKRTFIILEPQLLVLSANITNAFDCDNANSGAINLLVAGGTAPFTYVWSNGATTEDLANIAAGNYLVTVEDANGCSKQAQYSINRPPAIEIGVVTKTEFDCENKYVNQTFVADVSGGVPPYKLTWSSGTVSGANNEMMNTSQNGTAILYVTDAIGCESNYSFNVKLQSLGTASYNASSYSYSTFGAYSINDPIEFTNTATGDYISILWDFGDGSVSAEPNPVHTFINPKDYVVTQTVTYPFGCIYVQKITFIVGKGYLLVVPNAFTPNDDNLNDTFRPVTKALKNVSLDIYDTWGSLIYSETGDILRGWDGKIKGQNAENGNYYCKVSGETFYGTVVNVKHPFVLIK
ncbi:PKD domain-containing protein [Flavobacterium sp. W22_SRS_FP1]|uniref:PKD domain-containing protein n=1 Tax=Flavobacterium sp. W22_SRS_FP1 TaxID=3240276 RepID=UPI003F8EBBE4